MVLQRVELKAECWIEAKLFRAAYRKYPRIRAICCPGGIHSSLEFSQLVSKVQVFPLPKCFFFRDAALEVDEQKS